MKNHIQSALLGGVVCLIGVLIYRFVDQSDGQTNTELTLDPQPSQWTSLQDEVTSLKHQMAALERAVERSNLRHLQPVPPTRELSSPANNGTQSAGSTRVADTYSALWYLENYAASFNDGGGGSEYFRLAVDAFAPTILDRILSYLSDPNQPTAFRRELIKIVGTARFIGDQPTLSVLLRILQPIEREFAANVFDALLIIGDSTTVVSLESLVLRIERGEFRWRALGLLVSLAGLESNRYLGRLLAAADDIETQSTIIGLISVENLNLALECFRQVLGLDQPARLVGAKRIGVFKSEEFRSFVESWINIERDDEVLAALGAARDRQKTISNWAAQKTVGPPDVPDPKADSPAAWAPKSQKGGLEWLEVDYAPARLAHGVRIHEVCTAGAVIEVVAISESGQQLSVWKGVDPLTQPGVFEVSFPLTSSRIKAIRINLDTRRGNGNSWCEIDAVELLSPDGNGWAVDARASTTYGADDQMGESLVRTFKNNTLFLR